MRIKLIITLLVLVSLFMVSCDRFEKPTKNEVEEIDYNLIVTDFFVDFSATAKLITATNTADFMGFFHDNYLYDGKTKQDIADMINAVFLVNEPRFINVELISNDELSIEWNLLITTTNDTVVETMNFVDRLIEEEGIYTLYGNQVDADNEDKLMAFAEIMTATWCINCPAVEAAMHDYLYSNPENFFYLEYHTQDDIAGQHEFFDNFYRVTSAPTTILQGQDIFVGNSLIDTYEGILDNYKALDAQLKLSNLVQTTGTENYQANLDIEKLITEEFDTNNLKLRWAFYEEESAFNNYIGQPCRHVVLTEGYYNIELTDLDTTFPISIDYPRDIPEDMGIVFWLQTAGDTHDDTSFVHAWIKQDVRSK